MTKLHPAIKIICALKTSVSYLLILALGSSGLIQFKGLFDQTALPLPLSLRVVWGEGGAKVLISVVEKGSNTS